MSHESREAHWETVYEKKNETELSWFQECPSASIALIDRIIEKGFASVIDIGGGSSRLVDHLIDRGFDDVSVLDLSNAALQTAKARLGNRAARVSWIHADATAWEPPKTYAIWHDRAAFHFLTEQRDRSAYIARLARGVKPGGHAIIATFALNGPEKCSGLPVMRYDPQSLGSALGSAFQLVDTLEHLHDTPSKSTQAFQYCVFRFSR